MPVVQHIWTGSGWRDYDSPGAPSAWDWSDSNLPWTYSAASDWESRLPGGVPVVNIQTASGDFWTNLNATVNAQAGRFICRLGSATYGLNSFRLVGGSGDVTYSFGFWFPKLAGFVGNGPDNTFVQMNANSMSAAQLSALSAKTQASFAPNQMGLCRIDSSTSQPFYLGGLTFRAANQQDLTSISGDITGGVTVPQSAPHQGVVLYTDSTGTGTVSHVRFQGAGKAMNSQPPFEHANATSQRNIITWYNCELDGRISPTFDAAQPRKCGGVDG